MSAHCKNDVQDSPITTKDKVLETGASLTQSFAPLKSVCAHLNAFHVYASDPSRSVEANHYCMHITGDVLLPRTPCTSHTLWLEKPEVPTALRADGLNRSGNVSSLMRQRTPRD